MLRSSRTSAAIIVGGATAAGMFLWSAQCSSSGENHCNAAPIAPTQSSGRLESWHARWEAGRTKWHLPKPHPLLKQFEEKLFGPVEVRRSQCVLFPLCGSSVDLAYLARRGHDVVGVDCVGLALDALLSDWGEELKVGGVQGVSETSSAQTLKLRMGKAAWFQKVAAEQTGLAERGSPYFAAELLRAVEGDFMEFSPQVAASFGLGQFDPALRATNGTFDVAFDRGSIVAIHPDERQQYAKVLTSLMAPGGKVLLVAVEHEPQFGPPHSITHDQVKDLFESNFDVALLQREDKLSVEPEWRDRGATVFEEVAYLLTRK